MTSLSRIAIVARRTADIPPIVVGFSPVVPDDDGPDVADDAPRVIQAGVSGVTLAIEYRDSRGAESRRRVTLIRLRVDAAGNNILDAFCHERRALRTFRFDRVRAIIDLDGEVHTDPTAWLVAVLGVVPPWMPDIRAPGATHRRLAGPGALFLVALSRADGQLVVDEAMEILNYMTERADLDGVETTGEDAVALAKWIPTLRPTRDQVEEAARALDLAPAIERRLLLRAAVRVMDADGVQHPAEFAMVLEARDRLG